MIRGGLTTNWVRALQSSVIALSLIALLLANSMATAQVVEEPAPAVLVADNVQVTRARVLIARGNVEVFQGNVSLKAQSITYDQDNDLLTFEGPLIFRDGPSTVILADAAELDRHLKSGILTSARLVID